MKKPDRFNSLPSFKPIHQRQKTRKNFLKTDHFQLLLQAKEIQERLASTKAVLQEVSAIEESKGSESSVYSNKIIEYLVSEKFQLQNSIKRVQKEKDKSLLTMERSLLSETIEKEEQSEIKYRDLMDKELKISIELEKKAEILNDRGNKMLKQVKSFLDTAAITCNLEDQKQTLH